LENINEIESLNRRLEQKNTEFKEFIYRTSHDMRGPIATIKGLVEVAKMENRSPELNIYFDKINKVTDRLDTLLEHLRATFGNEDFIYFEIYSEELVDKLVSRLTRLKQLYDLDFHLKVLDKPEKIKFINNSIHILVLVENFLLILSSARLLYNIKYSVEIGYAACGIFINVIYNKITLSSVKTTLEQIGATNLVESKLRNEYNDVRISILNQCIKLTDASIRVTGKGSEVIINISFPSILLIKRKN
jgi:hypothetical protein